MELPELPEGDVDTPMGNEAWTREQMRAYALEAVRAERERAMLGGRSMTSLKPPGPTIADAIRDAVLAERERIAGLVLHKAELLVLPSDSWAKTYLVDLAAAIRAQGR